MAQIIKIEDYISRYEIDVTRYTNQFIRFKKRQWEQLKEEEPSQISDKKQPFLDHIFQHQLIWASSTVRSCSYMDKKYEQDTMLKHLAQSLPDQYLILYYPVFSIKKAPIEADVVIICPNEILCLSIITGEKEEVVMASEGRFWVRRGQEGEKKMVNPLPSLNRTVNIVQRIVKECEVELPIRPFIISRMGYIHAPELPRQCRTVDKRSYREWIEKLQQNPSPIKHQQLKMAKMLLSITLTNSYDRFEFDM